MTWNAFFSYDLGQEFLSTNKRSTAPSHHGLFQSKGEAERGHTMIEEENQLRKNITFYSQATFYTPLIANLCVAVFAVKDFISEENESVNTALGLAIIFTPVLVSFIIPALENQKIQNMNELKRMLSPIAHEQTEELLDEEELSDLPTTLNNV